MRLSYLPYLYLFLALLAGGCTEGQKQNPLSRATPGGPATGSAAAQTAAKASAPAPATTEPAKSPAPVAKIDLEPLDPPGPPLYEKLGGDKGVAKIVDAFVANAAEDEKVAEEHKRPFRDDVTTLKRQLTLQLAQAAGGPRLIAGPEPSAVRQALNVPAPEFEALLSDFRKALDSSQVPAGDREPLLRVLERLRAEAVGQ